MPPDPKAGKRIIAPAMLAHARAVLPLECASCHRPPGSVHHVLPKGSPHYGDDVLENLVLVCGNGTRGCHGAFHGSPYIDHKHIRWDTVKVATAIGETLRLTRPEVIRYVLGKLGPEPGFDYLVRVYRFDPLSHDQYVVTDSDERMRA